MGFFSLFSGKKPEALEKKGDTLFAEKAFGPAKLEYEKARAKNDAAPSDDPAFKTRIEKKIAGAKQELAKMHTLKAEELMEAECFTDAEDRLTLAMTLTEDADLKSRIKNLLAEINDLPRQNQGAGIDKVTENMDKTDPAINTMDEIDENEYFAALVNSMPPQEQKIYPGYGSAFKKGFIAMNQGDFDLASTYLEMALEEQKPETCFIHLELATCRLNQDDPSEAKILALEFLDHFPTSIRGWQILSEAMWGLGEFDEAMEQLSLCPKEISNTIEMEILRGETLILSNEVKKANSLYLSLVNKGKRDQAVLINLAKTYELLSDHREANKLYLELLNQCASCGAKPDPNLRLRFAETSMAMGEATDKEIEIYLDLAKEDPFNKSNYFKRVSEIYSNLGNPAQAERFRLFAET